MSLRGSGLSSRMVTADELGTIAIFAGRSEADRERLARATADITLAPGSTPHTKAASAPSSEWSLAAR